MVAGLRLPRSAARLAGYYLKPLQECGAKAVLVDLPAFCRATGLSHRMAQIALATLRKLAAAVFDFKRVRLGRSFRTLISLRNPYKKEGFTFGKTGKTLKHGQYPAAPAKPLHAPAGRVSIFSRFEGKASRGIRALASWLTRNRLRWTHWDNCKITWDERHAFNFALRGLQAGHNREKIVAAYDRALHLRHGDATDHDLNHGRTLAKWAPSSTVTLAASFLV